MRNDPNSGSSCWTPATKGPEVARSKPPIMSTDRMNAGGKKTVRMKTRDDPRDGASSSSSNLPRNRRFRASASGVVRRDIPMASFAEMLTEEVIYFFTQPWTGWFRTLVFLLVLYQASQTSLLGSSLRRAAYSSVSYLWSESSTATVADSARFPVYWDRALPLPLLAQLKAALETDDVQVKTSLRQLRMPNWVTLRKLQTPQSPFEEAVRVLVGLPPPPHAQHSLR